MGETIEDENGEIIGSSPTFVTSVNSLIYKQAEEDTVVYVESTVLTQEAGRERIGSINNIDSVLQGFCKSIKKIKTNVGRKLEEQKEDEE
ncbi:hypothetical protein Stok01_00783 [Sulfurisphaera tokodaii]